MTPQDRATIAARELAQARRTRRPVKIRHAAQAAIDAAEQAAASATSEAGRAKWERRAASYRAVLAEWTDKPAPVIGRPRMQAEAASVHSSVSVTPTQHAALTWLGGGHFRAGVRRAGDLAAEEMSKPTATARVRCVGEDGEGTAWYVMDKKTTLQE